MRNRNFREAMHAKWAEGKFVCIGLDPVWEKLPPHLLAQAKNVGDHQVLFEFCRAIIDTTKDLVHAYKPNTAFFEAYGVEGITALKEVCEYIHAYTDVLIIADAKRADIESTNLGYARFVFDYLGADAITVHPWLGHMAMKPFLDCKEKGIIILAKTSNKGSDEFQNMAIETPGGQRMLAYEYVAMQVRDTWNGNDNCLLVVGATYPEELSRIRAILPTMGILCPGIGAQDGDLETTLKAGLIDGKQEGMIISSSRGIIYASSGIDFAEKAREEAIVLDNTIRRLAIRRLLDNGIEPFSTTVI